MNAPNDQTARERFANELERNFSVVASAGSGKTTAITQRVLSIARSAKAADLLPRLVVVTYANRAADEMQQRTRQSLLAENLPAATQAAFNRAFFGTIHAFCLQLLTNYGHHLGLPAPLELLTDDDELWREFVQTQARIGHSLGENNRAALFRFVQARDLLELARNADFVIPSPDDLPSVPDVDLSDIYAYAESRDTISKTREELREWEKRLAAGWEFLRWPNCFATGKDFTKLWREKFSPLRQWVGSAAMAVAAEVQQAYREFRFERGLVTYDDQIELAKELLAHPIAGPLIREQNFRVILDEAQDTAPSQFSVLLEITRSKTAHGEWRMDDVDPPQAGRFCMVGDFQQSIYREPADLKYYRAVHDALVRRAGAEALKFSVTFRLDEKQLAFVNATFREILNGKDDQVEFVELQPRPTILPGQVIRLPLPADLLGDKDSLKDNEKARLEAKFLAQWIADAGLEKLGADSWREVAILCPRKAWLQTIAAALRRLDLPVAIQSEREVNGDSPAYAWLTALLTVLTDPRNAYEIVGVLREIFGVSDHDLAIFSEGHGSRFRIDKVLKATGQVSSHLRGLAETREKIEGLALFDAVSLAVRETQLRERLSILPQTEFGDLGRELDTLLAQAAELEANGMILHQFAQRLRDDFSKDRAVRFSADENAIQLITSQKAKGSEWQAVILPFLGRDIRLPGPRYPHLVRPPDGSEPFVALSKDEKVQIAEAQERAHHQETERLLYVATTRARRTLVLVLDHDLFSDKKNNFPKNAPLRRLIRGDKYGGEFDGLTNLLTIEGAPSEKARKAPPSFGKIDKINAPERKRAEKTARDFIRKFTPSELDPEDVWEARQGARASEPAVRYGRWWHYLLERIDWKSGTGAAQKLFETELPLSPDAAAAMRDWNASRENLFGEKVMADFLARAHTKLHCEFPFTWRRRNQTVLEGLIDWLAIDHAAGEALLIDWKTNDLSLGQEEQLRARYLPQLAAYWKAVTEITQLRVQAGLFSTSLGRLFLYETTALQNEWARLEKIPPVQLEDEIQPDEAILAAMANENY